MDCFSLFTFGQKTASYQPSVPIFMQGKLTVCWLELLAFTSGFIFSSNSWQGRKFSQVFSKMPNQSTDVREDREKFTKYVHTCGGNDFNMEGLSLPCPFSFAKRNKRKPNSFISDVITTFH